MSGLENIPDVESALIIYYHGAVPVDVYYFLSKVMLFKNRMVHTVADRFLFKIPGLFGFINLILSSVIQKFSLSLSFSASLLQMVLH